MVESEDWRNALHLARMGVLYGSIIEVSLSSMALVQLSSFRLVVFLSRLVELHVEKLGQSAALFGLN